MISGAAYRVKHAQTPSKASEQNVAGMRRFETTERSLAGGLCTLIIAMGIGRFAYTPILPAMQSGVGMSYAEAGLLASLNYAGYLIGALGAGFVRAGMARTLWFRGALIVCIATTGAMAATESVPGWGALRLLSGIARAPALISMMPV